MSQRLPPSRPTPGPTSTPATIPIYDPFRSAQYSDPYPDYAFYRTHDPVHRGRPALPGYPPGWYVFRHADALCVLRDTDTFRQQRPRTLTAEHVLAHRLAEHDDLWRVVDHWMLLQDAAAHSRLRALVSRAFSPARIGELETRIKTIAHAALDAVQRDQAGDLMTDFAAPLPIAVIGHLLGITIADPARFRAQSRAIAMAIDMRTSAEPLDCATSAMREWTRDLREQVAAKREKPGADLASELIAACDEHGALDEDELIAMLALLLFTGQETTCDLIGLGVYTLLRHPEQRSALQTNPGLLDNAINEILRFDSPVQSPFMRTAARDMTLGNAKIAEGDTISVLLGAANRDPDAVQDPDRFDITRDTARTGITFGHGVHFCLGAHLARLEARVAISALLTQRPGLCLTGRAVTWRANVAFRGLISLPVRY
ncbi:MAG: cytochrome P450 [Gammaproteobacteria bacterium]|jgi:cytochrome P450